MWKSIWPCLTALVMLGALPQSLAQEVTQEHTRINPCDEGSTLQGDCQNSGNDDRGGWTQNPDGSFRDSDGRTVDGGSRRTPAPIGSGDRPYTNFQTSDSHFNDVLNWAHNNPASCIRGEDLRYLIIYVNHHPELRGSVDFNWLLKRDCDDPDKENIVDPEGAYHTTDAEFNSIVNYVIRTGYCVDREQYDYVVNFLRANSDICPAMVQDKLGAWDSGGACGFAAPICADER